MSFYYTASLFGPLGCRTLESSCQRVVLERENDFSERKPGQIRLLVRSQVHKIVQIYVELHHLRTWTVSLLVLIIFGLLLKISKLTFIKPYFFVAKNRSV